MYEHRHLKPEIGVIKVNSEVMFYSLMQEFSIKVHRLDRIKMMKNKLQLIWIL